MVGFENSTKRTGSVRVTAEGTIASPTPKSILNGVLVFPMSPNRLTLIPWYSLISLILSTPSNSILMNSLPVFSFRIERTNNSTESGSLE